jgi:predicted MFS family arabinose efflux permease
MSRRNALPLGLAVVVAGALMLSLNMGVRQTYGLFLAPMTAALDVSHASFGLAIAVQNLLWGALTPFCGVLADRFGTGRVLVSGGVVYVAGLVVMALAESALGLHMGAGILTGIAVSATGFPLVLSAVARAAPPEKRSMWLGIATAGGSMGQFVLLPATQALIGGFGWSAALMGLALLTAVMVPLAWPLRGRPALLKEGELTLGAAFAEARAHHGYLLLNAGFFVCGFHVAFVATHFPAYVESQNLPAWIGAAALGVIGFFNIIGTFLFGWLGGRYRKKWVLTFIYLARAAAITGLLVLPATSLTIWAFAMAFGTLWLGTVPLTSGLVGQIFGPRYLATLFGVVMFSHQIGAFFGAWLGGISFDLTGSYTVIWLMAVALSLAAAALHAPIADEPLRPEAAPVR